MYVERQWNISYVFGCTYVCRYVCICWMFTPSCVAWTLQFGKDTPLQGRGGEKGRLLQQQQQWQQQQPQFVGRRAGSGSKAESVQIYRLNLHLGAKQTHKHFYTQLQMQQHSKSTARGKGLADGWFFFGVAGMAFWLAEWRDFAAPAQANCEWGRSGQEKLAANWPAATIQALSNFSAQLATAQVPRRTPRHGTSPTGRPLVQAVPRQHVSKGSTHRQGHRYAPTMPAAHDSPAESSPGQVRVCVCVCLCSHTLCAICQKPAHVITALA